MKSGEVDHARMDEEGWTGPGDQPRNSCEIPGKSRYRLAFGRGFRNEKKS